MKTEEKIATMFHWLYTEPVVKIPLSRGTAHLVSDSLKENIAIPGLPEPLIPETEPQYIVSVRDVLARLQDEPEVEYLVMENGYVRVWMSAFHYLKRILSDDDVSQEIDSKLESFLEKNRGSEASYIDLAPEFLKAKDISTRDFVSAEEGLAPLSHTVYIAPFKVNDTNYALVSVGFSNRDVRSRSVQRFSPPKCFRMAVPLKELSIAGFEWNGIDLVCKCFRGRKADSWEVREGLFWCRKCQSFARIEAVVYGEEKLTRTADRPVFLTNREEGIKRTVRAIATLGNVCASGEVVLTSNTMNLLSLKGITGEDINKAVGALFWAGAVGAEEEEE